MQIPRHAKFYLGALILCLGLLSLPALADSLARIVRLSDVDGTVQIDHGNGLEKALRNMPITEGSSLRTEDGGLAEVEFENGSTLRLAPDTRVSFPDLKLNSSGAKLTTVKVEMGTAYLQVTDPKHDQFRVLFAQERTDVKGTADFRIDFDKGNVQVAVMKGDLQIEGPSGSLKATKEHTVTFDLTDQDRYQIAKGVQPEQYDEWSKQETQYQKDYNHRNSANGSFPYDYGISDLNYYGDFFNVPGYGWMWQPSFVGAGWDPFMNGAWSWYPGVGYTWVSGNPWGWMPYRYGSWAFLPGWGWCWQPGNFFAWNAVPNIYNSPSWYVPPRTPNVIGRRPVGNSVGHPTIAVSRPLTAPQGQISAGVRAHAPEAGEMGRAQATRPLGTVGAKTSPAKGTVTAIHGAPLLRPTTGASFSSHVMPLQMDAESRGMVTAHEGMSISHAANTRFEGGSTTFHGSPGMTSGRTGMGGGMSHGTSSSHGISSSGSTGHVSSSSHR